MTNLPAAPGDVLAVCTGHTTIENLIRAGEALQGKPAIANHVAIVTHQDAAGRWIGIEGRPGGVGPCDCTPYLTNPDTRTNHDQPRPNDQKQTPVFLASCVKSLGIAYDWAGIAEDALNALHVEDLAQAINPLWRWPADHNRLPGHVVCSSLAAMLYNLPQVGWAHPNEGYERTCEPADWWNWSATCAWLRTRQATDAT